MTAITLPIFGQGSQPAEEDGVELDYLQMPEEMFIYRMPQISVDLNAANLAQAKATLQQLEQDLLSYPASGRAIDLTGLDETNRRFVDELIGEGEVSAICRGAQTLRIQESVLAGVWRLQSLDAQQQMVSDTLEVGIMPHQISQIAFADAARQIDTDWAALPEGVMNAPPLLAELNAHTDAYQPDRDPHVINLSLLPQTEQDLAFLEQRLGQGPVTILSRGYGNCRITATGSRFVWWVRYFNSQDSLILNTLEVSQVPTVACASPEDIADSRQRLREILQVYL
ncbi:MAG: hydrogenase expression/formation protein [Methylomonas sp.]|jgi:hydrogenase-1 operon protein HyaF|uniref:hydrogenase expression/formation protein n=1 Tax=Methylomonas sp. TaxID=418 RepID=UPI0025E9F3A2|nr:hydrogenase expression/formation protein [Methylomonas sp.]MCK9607442.1 hydrogenase expression/formation protein [Methylomonas sp.]